MTKMTPGLKPIFSYLMLLIFYSMTILCFGTAIPLHAETHKSQDPIKIILNNWTSQVILSKITGRIFEEMGYRVEYDEQDSNEQWGALNRGKSHVQVEVWEGTSAKLFYRMIEDGGVVDAGTHKAVTREEWWYPSFVEELCPGLPDWRALKECSSIFAVDATRPFGRYLAGPWEKPDRARIRALGLKFKVVEVTAGDDLKQKLIDAVNNREPILLFNWTPNWVEARFEGRFIEFPDYDPDCETNPQWGINPEFHHDCGNPRTGWLKKAAWSGMRDKWLCAFETLRKISFDNETISKLTLMVDIENRSPEEAADNWIRNNKALWKSWISSPCIIK